MSELHINDGYLALLTQDTVKPDEVDDLVDSPEELSFHHGEHMYLLIGYEHNAVELFGCPTREGLLTLAVYFNIFMLTVPGTMFRGQVTDASELPYQLNPNMCAMVLFRDKELRMFFRMDKATEYIERAMMQYSESTIGDFVVVIGEEIELDIEEWNLMLSDGAVTYG